MVILEFILSIIGFVIQQLPFVIELIILYIAGRWLFNYFRRAYNKSNNKGRQ